MMNEHSIRLLDFARIRSSVAEYCISNEGRQLLLSSVPVNNEEYLERFKDEVAALSSYLSKNDLPGCTFPEIESAMEHLGVEGLTLEGDELCALGTWAKSFDLVTSFLSKAHVLVQHSVQVQQLPKASAHKVAELVQDAPEMQSSEAWVTQTLSYLVAASPKLTDVHRIIQSVFQDDGQMRELPSIRRAREEITRANRDIQSVVARYRDNPEVRVALQNEEAIQRDGRTVLAVKANFKSRVSGIIHEVSASGQTVFVEPADLVEKNNELVQKEAQLKAEIFRVLRETTEKLKPYRQSLEAARASLAQMDVRLARALQCKREKLSFAASCPQGISIWNARHPFLGKKAVPIDVLLPEDIRTLIITGPNTGGKTVTLKTVGLLAMMNQFGLAIPAAEGTKLAVFDDILADIGDEQSIDESLSTFSGHMKVIAEIAHRATSKSLVLLDELGAGTDPEEGCALAMGLLDYFIDKGSLTLVTTHHGVLKKYGYTKKGCLNASMEFDPNQLAPTYRVVMGVPGESRALEIAAQTGLQPEIVALSRQYLSPESANIGELIRGLSEKQRELEQLEAEERRRLSRAMDAQRKADLETLRAKQKELELRKNGISELQQLLSESRKTLENLVKELRENGASVEQTRQVKQFLSQLSTKIDKENQALAEQQVEVEADLQPDVVQNPALVAASRVESGELREGREVFYGPRRQRALLVRQHDETHWVVQLGSVKMKVPIRDIFLNTQEDKEYSLSLKPAYDVELTENETGKTAHKALFEMDLRGFRLKEALAEVEKQIDAASLQGLQTFSIIHGTGEGVLSKGIHEFLSRSGAVADYYFARPEDGGFGKTIVHLKG